MTKKRLLINKDKIKQQARRRETEERRRAKLLTNRRKLVNMNMNMNLNKEIMTKANKTKITMKRSLIKLPSKKMLDKLLRKLSDKCQSK